MEFVVVEVAQGVATVTLNRPQARNALSAALLHELSEAFRELHAREDVRAVVLAAADPVFSAGVDLKELAQGGANLTRAAVQSMGSFDRPIIGAINGAAVTGGLELALACDFRIASDRARFADTHAQVGIVPGWGLSVRLPRAVGVAWARQMSFTGRFVDAALAQRIGLVNQVVAHEELLPTAQALGEDVASADPATIVALRHLYDRVEGLVDQPGLAIETAGFERQNATLDFAAVGERLGAVTERSRS